MSSFLLMIVLFVTRRTVVKPRKEVLGSQSYPLWVPGPGLFSGQPNWYADHSEEGHIWQNHGLDNNCQRCYTSLIHLVVLPHRWHSMSLPSWSVILVLMGIPASFTPVCTPSLFSNLLLTSQLHSNVMLNLHSDNRKEFSTTVMVDILNYNTQNCFLLTGHSCSPCDRGFVGNMNKIVQHVLKSISAERCLKGLEVNWTNLLRQSCCV